jgi:hypothetical protein
MMMSSACSAFPISAIALSGFGLSLGVLAPVGGEGAADVVAFLELALGIATDVTLVSTGVDQLSLGSFGSWHGVVSPSLVGSTTERQF